MGGVSLAGAHDFGIFHDLWSKIKNSNNFTFDSGINLKLLHKQDIDMKNDSCDFHQNLTYNGRWRHSSTCQISHLATWAPSFHFGTCNLLETFTQGGYWLDERILKFLWKTDIMPSCDSLWRHFGTCWPGTCHFRHSINPGNNDFQIILKHNENSMS